MRITEPGRITDRIFFLGRTESCVYLVKGYEEYALIGGGMSYIAPEIPAQIRNFGLDEDKIKRLIILHAHFDHVGCMPYFKKRWPWAKITASAKVKEMFVNPMVIDTVTTANQALAEEYGLEKEIQEQGLLDFAGLEIDKAVGEGDSLSCGDLTFEIIDARGHSSCSIAVYLPEEKALFASDSGGIPYGKKAFTVANSNFDLYQQTLKKMAALDVDVFLAGHYGALIGQDAGDFIKESIEEAQETRELIEECYARIGDIRKTAQEITRIRLDASPGYFLSEEMVGKTTLQMVKNLLKLKDN
ncbi:MAG: MBL fold metallo-hydrolase [Deltaproteobacteria bacterium]|nr:MBL fold metallo-hydrolase [Deltaproteobacteria bacterium]